MNKHQGLHGLIEIFPSFLDFGDAEEANHVTLVGFVWFTHTRRLSPNPEVGNPKNDFTNTPPPHLKN